MRDLISQAIRVFSEANLPLLHKPLNPWLQGFSEEIHFWKNWIEHDGACWQDEFRERQDPDRPFDVSLLGTSNVPLRSDGLNVLYVGAGPLTILGCRLSSSLVRVRAVDPLADIYRRCLKTKGIIPPVWTEFGIVEALDIMFLEKTSSDVPFQVVHIRNALDHSFDPIFGILQCLAVTGRGRRVVLRHFVNEAVNAGYQGLHGFNLVPVSDSDVKVWNKDQAWSVLELFGPIARIFVRSFPGSCEVVLEPVLDASAYRDVIGSIDPSLRRKIILDAVQELMSQGDSDGIC